MNNAVFGKTMENVKNRIQLHLTTDETNAIKWFSKMTFKNSKEFDNLYMIEMFKQEVIYDKPIYVGTSILDLSKLHMMKFHYEVIHKQFEGKYELIYSDTDSYIYHIYHSDIYEWIGKNKQHFDLSDDKYNCDNTNKKVLGLMKDEACGDIMTSVTATNPKTYCHTIVNRNDKTNASIDVRKAKGVPKTVINKKLVNEDYKNTIDTGDNVIHEFHAIRSLNHKVVTIKSKKICLSSYYDKLYLTDSNTCLPYGHYSIPK